MQKPKIKFSNNFEDITIVFPDGEIAIVKKNDIHTKARYDVDDNLERNAYDVQKLLQTCHLPRSIYCPITRMPMCDPVICADGFSYERKDLQKWMKKKQISPMTGEPLKHSLIAPNHSLRNTISEILE